MSLAQLTISLHRWERKVTYRARKLETARDTGHKDHQLTAVEIKRIHKWEKLLSAARQRVARREKQIKAKNPLRLRAWEQMQRLIDMKVTESGGNNHGVMVEKIIRAAGGTPGEPWCGDTVAYCYLKAGAKSVVRAWASVWGGLEKLLGRVNSPLRGHVVIYAFGSGHTGLFKEWATEHGPGFFWAGEGNTGNSGAQSDSITGSDGVKLKLRHTRDVRSFRRVLR